MVHAATKGLLAAMFLAMASCPPANHVDLLLSVQPAVSLTAGDPLHNFFLIDAGVFVDRTSTGTTNGPITITYPVPPGFHWDSTFTQGNDGWQCTEDASTVTCLTFKPVASGSNGIDVYLRIVADPDLNGTFTSTVTLVSAGDPNLQNNARTFPITVAPLPLITTNLDFSTAAHAGAQFPVTVARNENCHQLGVGDWLDDAWGAGDWTNGRHPGPIFVADCGTHQGEAFVEAFSNFRLKNGWVVKSFREDDFNTGDVAFNLDMAPVTGGCAPLMKTHLRNYGLSTRGFGPYGRLRVAFQITLEGPAGTDPYTGDLTSSCTTGSSRDGANPAVRAHACEPGTVEVTTKEGTLGCMPPPGSGRSFRCNSTSDCLSDFICPGSGPFAGQCVAGHVP